MIFIKKTATIVQTLSIYGACGIVGFGWVLSRLLHFDCGGYAASWFCAAIFIYNLDRLRADPADPINTPQRSRDAAKLRKYSLATAVLAAIALLLVPFFRRDWLMLGLTACGALVCANYSIPLLGFRFKEIPLVKTFFAPVIVTVAFLAPPFLQQGAGSTGVFYTAFAWTLFTLLFNMILCDLRDIEGDTATGIRSLPVALGSRRTMLVLACMLPAIAALFLLAAHESAAEANAWRVIGGGMTLYLAGLLAVVWKVKSLPEFFYEWWVEGILIAPLLFYGFVR